MLPISVGIPGRPRMRMHADVDRASPHDLVFAVRVFGFSGLMVRISTKSQAPNPRLHGDLLDAKSPHAPEL